MPCEILVKAVSDRRLASRRGRLMSVKPAGFVWGGAESPPRYAKVIITDATVAEVEPYLQHWRWEYIYVENSTPNQSVDMDVSINPRITVVHGDERGMTIDMRDHIIAEFPTTSWNPFGRTTATLEIPRNEVPLISEIQDAIDQFDVSLGHKFHFTDLEVDRIVAAGFEVSMPFVELEGVMNDRSE